MNGLYIARVIHGALDLFLNIWAGRTTKEEDEECDIHYWLTKAKEACWDYQQKNN